MLKRIYYHNLVLQRHISYQSHTELAMDVTRFDQCFNNQPRTSVQFTSFTIIACNIHEESLLPRIRLLFGDLKCLPFYIILWYFYSYWHSE